MEPELHALWLALSTHTSVSVAKNSLYLSKKKKKKKQKKTSQRKIPSPLGMVWLTKFFLLVMDNHERTLSNPILLPPRHDFYSQGPSKEWPELFSGTRILFSSINCLQDVATPELLMCYSHFIFFSPYFSLAVLRYYWHVALFKGYNLMIWNV